MDKIVYSLSDIRKIIYEGEFARFPYIRDWKSNPYTCFKARYYIEGSILLTYLLLKTSVKANTITLFYCLAGIAGGILLAIPDKVAILLGVLVFFNKGIIDWTDGYIARLKYGSSLTGHILDCYGAKLNSLGFAIGLGLYVYNRNQYEWLVFLLALIPFFRLLF